MKDSGSLDHQTFHLWRQARLHVNNLVTGVFFFSLNYSRESLWTAKRSDHVVLRKSTLNIHWKDCSAEEIFIGRTDAEAETPILWPHDGKN